MCSKSSFFFKEHMASIFFLIFFGEVIRPQKNEADKSRGYKGRFFAFCDVFGFYITIGVTNFFDN